MGECSAALEQLTLSPTMCDTPDVESVNRGGTVSLSVESRIEWLTKLEQGAWDRTVEEILPALHEVDRLPLKIWFAWWPIKLGEGLSRAPDLDVLERDWQLEGQFSLADQLPQTIQIFYAAFCWQEVARSTLEWAQADGEPPQTDLSNLLMDRAKEVARLAKIDVGLVLPLQAVAFMALRQVGSQPLRKGWSAARRSLTPAKLFDQRQREPRAGIFSFLRNADRQHSVCFDEVSGDRFKAYQDQDLSMASAMDTRDHTVRDPRCTEGPIPFQCRSGFCGSCWIGVIGGKERLASITEYEKKRLRYFGYMSAQEEPGTHPPIRLACQAACQGSVTILVPPWNGVLEGRD